MREKTSCIPMSESLSCPFKMFMSVGACSAHCFSFPPQPFTSLLRAATLGLFQAASEELVCVSKDAGRTAKDT